MASASIIQCYLANNQGSGHIYPLPPPLTVATHSAWWHSWWGKGQSIQFANYNQHNTTGSPFLTGNSLQDPGVEADLNRKCAGVGHLVDLLCSLSSEEFPLLKRSKAGCFPEHWQVIAHTIKVRRTHCLQGHSEKCKNTHVQSIRNKNNGCKYNTCQGLHMRNCHDVWVLFFIGARLWWLQ